MIAIPALVLIIAVSASPAFGQTARQLQDASQSQQAPVNPAIDMQGFLRVSQLMIRDPLVTGVQTCALPI